MNRSSEYFLDAGGKGIHVSRVLVQLGERVIHLTHAGGRNTDYFLELAKQDGIKVVWAPSGSEIRYCYTILSKGKHSTTEIVEESMPIFIGAEDGIYAKYLSLLPDAHTVIISGSKAPGYSDSIFPSMVREAKRAGKLVVLDIRGKDLIDSLSFSPDIIKPNYDEFIATFFEGTIPSEEEVIAMMRDIYEKHGSVSVLTCGAKPVVYVRNGEVMRALPPRIVPVNTTGSGDAFCAGFSKSLREDHDVDRAVASGIECGTQNAVVFRAGSIRKP